MRRLLSRRTILKYTIELRLASQAGFTSTSQAQGILLLQPTDYPAHSAYHLSLLRGLLHVT